MTLLLFVAAAILEKVGKPNIKLQMVSKRPQTRPRPPPCRVHPSPLSQDIFHCQIMDGNLSQNLQRYFPLIGESKMSEVCRRGTVAMATDAAFPSLTEAGSNAAVRLPQLTYRSPRSPTGTSPTAPES